jgi:flavin-dependent dehydrogenase
MLEALAAERFDVAVVGAGPAGSALAALLAGEDRKVGLLEKDRLPRDKLCGEFLSPEAIGSLVRIGCADRVLAAGPARIRSARFTLPGRASLELALPGEGWGISRRVLDEVLLRHAARAGAVVGEGMEVRAVGALDGRVDGSLSLLALPAASRLDLGAAPLRLTAGIVACAHGRGGRLDRALDRASSGGGGRIGFKRHLRPVGGADGEGALRDLSGVVELHAFQGGYCGLAPIEDGLVNLCCLLDPSFLRSLRGAGWETFAGALAGASPELAARLARLEPAGPLLSVAGVRLQPRECGSETALFLGDAAGMIAPFCGDGQAMALRSAVLLADLIGGVRGASWPRARLDLARRWRRRFRREFAERLRWGRWLDAALRHPLLARAAFAAIRRLPPLGRALVRRTRGSAGPGAAQV